MGFGAVARPDVYEHPQQGCGGVGKSLCFCASLRNLESNFSAVQHGWLVARESAALRGYLGGR